jgi:hypothetical protein
VTPPQPGPLGEEAARLVDAMSQWLGAQWARGGHDVPLATGSAECRVCPVCQVLSVVRQTRPEVFGHLADATSSFVAAVRTAVDAHAEHGAGQGANGHGANGRGGVERIDLDDDSAPDTWGAAR